jgi:hypothetical protein
MKYHTTTQLRWDLAQAHEDLAVALRECDCDIVGGNYSASCSFPDRTHALARSKRTYDTGIQRVRDARTTLIAEGLEL